MAEPCCTPGQGQVRVLSYYPGGRNYLLEQTIDMRLGLFATDECQVQVYQSLRTVAPEAALLGIVVQQYLALRHAPDGIGGAVSSCDEDRVDI